MGVFNQFSHKFSATSSAVAAKTQAKADTARCNSEIRSLEEQKKNLFAQIGQQYCLNHWQNPDANMIELMNLLKENENRIQHPKQTIEAKKRSFTCPVCGAPLSADAMFCGCYGHRVEEAPTPIKATSGSHIPDEM